MLSRSGEAKAGAFAYIVRRGKGWSLRLHYQAAKAGAFAYIIRQAKAGAFAYIVRQLDLEDLSRIHDVIGVDRLLDCTHDAHRFAVLGDQKVEFAAADPVLACAGAVE